MSPGWTNFIIIPKLKLAVEVSRNLTDLGDYESQALDLLVDVEEYEEYETLEVLNRKVSDLTVADIGALFKAKKISDALKGIECSKLLLYWLSSNDYDYSIISEMSFFDTEEWKEKTEGFTVLRMFEGEEE